MQRRLLGIPPLGLSTFALAGVTADS